MQRGTLKNAIAKPKWNSEQCSSNQQEDRKQRNEKYNKTKQKLQI